MCVLSKISVRRSAGVRAAASLAFGVACRSLLFISSGIGYGGMLAELDDFEAHNFGNVSIVDGGLTSSVNYFTEIAEHVSGGPR